MTRDEIYEHLAKVYLGKRDTVVQDQKSQPKPKTWIVLNIVITAVLILSTVYGFAAFLTRKADVNNGVFYALNNNPIRISYDLNEPYPATKSFAMHIPNKDVSRFTRLKMSVRGMNGAYPGIVKLIVANQKNEKATYFLQGVEADWKKVDVPFEKLNLTDLTTITDVTLVLEAWNVDFKKGVLLVDDISFSN